MAQSAGSSGTKNGHFRLVEINSDEPKLYRIVEVSAEELEGMKRGPDEGEVPMPRDHYDSDSQGHHGHSHGGNGGDHDIDHNSGGGFHYHSHPA